MVKSLKHGSLFPLFYIYSARTTRQSPEVDELSRRCGTILGRRLSVAGIRMEEAEALADRVGIMDRGKIVVEVTPAELIAQMGADNVQIVGHGPQDLFAQRIQTRPYVESFNAADGVLQVGVDAVNRRLVDIVETTNQCGFVIENLSVSEPSLGNVFLKFTGRQLRDK